MSPALADMPPAPLSAETSVHGPLVAGPAHHLSKDSERRYTVRPGDTVYDIAARHHTTVDAIVAVNTLRDRGRWIMPGQRLRISGPAPTAQKTSTSSSQAAPSASKASSSTAVTVRPGDTLYGIAAKHGLSVAALARANHLSSTRLIYPGQRLTLTASTTSNGASSADRRSTSTTSSRSGGVTVRAGDTLSSIAARHGVSLAAVQRANPDIQPRRLWVGATVRLPGAGGSASSTTSDSSTSSATTSRSQTRRGGPYTPQNIGDRYSTADVDRTFLHYTYSSPVARSAAANRDYLAGVPAPSREATRAMIVTTARRHGVDPALMLALSYQESGWNQRAVSPANAIGVMQVIPTSGDWASGLVGRTLNLLDPQDNITAGTVIMRALLRSTDSETKAIGGYYQGLGSIQRHGLFSDTTSYVRSIRALRARM